MQQGANEPADDNEQEEDGKRKSEKRIGVISLSGTFSMLAAVCWLVAAMRAAPSQMSHTHSLQSGQYFLE